MPNPVALHLSCVHCGGLLFVTIEPWENTPTAPVTLLKEDPTGEELPEERDAITTLVCPHCGKLNHGQLGGGFFGVTKDGASPITTQTTIVFSPRASKASKRKRAKSAR